MSTKLHTSQTANQATANQILLFFKIKIITDFHWSKLHGLAWQKLSRQNAKYFFGTGLIIVNPCLFEICRTRAVRFKTVQKKISNPWKITAR
jgi:hypothetical protein